jgi:hypothetical protein
VGAVNTEEKVPTTRCGKASEDNAQGERVVSMFVAASDGMTGLIQRMFSTTCIYGLDDLTCLQRFQLFYIPPRT